MYFMSRGIRQNCGPCNGCIFFPSCFSSIGTPTIARNQGTFFFSTTLWNAGTCWHGWRASTCWQNCAAALLHARMSNLVLYLVCCRGLHQGWRGALIQSLVALNQFGTGTISKTIFLEGKFVYTILSVLNQNIKPTQNVSGSTMIKCCNCASGFLEVWGCRVFVFLDSCIWVGAYSVSSVILASVCLLSG